MSDQIIEAQYARAAKEQERRDRVEADRLRRALACQTVRTSR